MPRMTPGMAVDTAMARSLQGTFGKDVKVTAGMSGSRYTLTVSGFPDYLTGRKVPVTVSFPGDAISVTEKGVKMRPLGDREVIFTADGRGYNHPHIWPDGHPCPGPMVKFNSIMDLMVFIYQTLTFRSVTDMSIEIGLMTPGDAARATHGPEGRRRLAAHKTRLEGCIEKRDDPYKFLEDRLVFHLSQAMLMFH